MAGGCQAVLQALYWCWQDLSFTAGESEGVPEKRDTIHLLAFAIFGITFCQFTYFMAIQASNAGTATVLQYLSPILILAVVCMRELRLPKRLELAAIGLSLCLAPLSSEPTGTYIPSTLRGGPVLGAFGSCELHDLYYYTGRSYPEI